VEQSISMPDCITIETTTAAASLIRHEIHRNLDVKLEICRFQQRICLSFKRLDPSTIIPSPFLSASRIRPSLGKRQKEIKMIIF
jgi:hypothetical protein